VHWYPSHRTWHRSAVRRHSGNRTWRQSAAHSHPGHRITVSPHLCRRNRGCENACYHATKENEFSPVHSVIGFKKLNPSGFEKYRRSPHRRQRRCYFWRPVFGRKRERTPFELASVLGCLDHVASFIVNADHSIVRAAVEFGVVDGVIRLLIPQAAERQRVAD
jgi:hypothetical protein